MNFRAFLPLLLLATVSLAACEGSYYPLSEPADSVIDESFTGTWLASSPDEETSLLSIIPFNNHEYLGMAWTPGEEGDALPVAIFTTSVEGALFANVRCLACDNDDGIYFLFKYERTSPDRMIVYSVEGDVYDELQGLNSTDAVRDFVKRYMSTDAFFDDGYGVYNRTEDETWPWISN